MRVDQAVNIEDLHRMAKRRLPKIMFDYIEGGVEDERGLSRNEAVFHRHRLLPRYLVDVSKRDQSATVFGQTFAHPFEISPIAGSNADPANRTRRQARADDRDDAGYVELFAQQIDDIRQRNRQRDLGHNYLANDRKSRHRHDASSTCDDFIQLQHER